MSTNFLDLVNFGTILSLEALCSLAEPLPPDSAGAAGVVMAGLTTEPTACLLGGEGGLRRGKAIKIKRNTPKKHNPYSPITTPSRSGAPLTSPHRLNVRLIRRPILDVRCRPTSRRTCKQNTTAINQGSNGQLEPKYKTKEVRCTLESVYAKGTSSGSGGLL